MILGYAKCKRVEKIPVILTYMCTTYLRNFIIFFNFRVENLPLSMPV